MTTTGQQSLHGSQDAANNNNNNNNNDANSNSSATTNGTDSTVASAVAKAGSVEQQENGVANGRPIVPGGPYGPDGTIIEEVMTTVVGKKQPVRGQAYRAPNGEYISYFCTDDAVLYRPGDSVYIESQRADQPFFICAIQEFRRSKRDNLMVNIRWFYRPSEVPENVYQLLVQDRNTENNNKELAIDKPSIKSRELFISDATDTYPVSVLRGHCRVDHYADIHAVREFLPDKNSFFYILGYNPETRRLASTQGEIRIGPSHQAKLPEFQPTVPGEPRVVTTTRPLEEVRWVPGATEETDLKMYLTAARSMAAYAGLVDTGSTEGCKAACHDDTTIAALDVLHNNNYDHGKALQDLVQSPLPERIDKTWSEEDTKKFTKGLRIYGKNFFRIRKELLQHKDTGELVSHYYLWKKTPAAAGHRPHRRHRRQNVLRRIRTPRQPRHNPPADPMDPSSTSEREDDSDDSDSKDRQGYHCRHCFTTNSRDWHHAGKDKSLLCYDCRLHFKRYGELPVITTPREPPALPPMPLKNKEQEEEVRMMRTRTRAKEQSNSVSSKDKQQSKSSVSKRVSRANTPDVGDSKDADSLLDAELPLEKRSTPVPRQSASPAPKKVKTKAAADDKPPDQQTPKKVSLSSSGGQSSAKRLRPEEENDVGSTIAKKRCSLVFAANGEDSYAEARETVDSKPSSAPVTSASPALLEPCTAPVLDKLTAPTSAREEPVPTTPEATPLSLVPPVTSSGITTSSFNLPPDVVYPVATTVVSAPAATQSLSSTLFVSNHSIAALSGVTDALPVTSSPCPAPSTTAALVTRSIYSPASIAHPPPPFGSPRMTAPPPPGPPPLPAHQPSLPANKPPPPPAHSFNALSQPAKRASPHPALPLTHQPPPSPAPPPPHRPSHSLEGRPARMPSAPHFPPPPPGLGPLPAPAAHSPVPTAHVQPALPPGYPHHKPGELDAVRFPIKPAPPAHSTHPYTPPPPHPHSPGPNTYPRPLHLSSKPDLKPDEAPLRLMKPKAEPPEIKHEVKPEPLIKSELKVETVKSDGPAGPLKTEFKAELKSEPSLSVKTESALMARPDPKLERPERGSNSDRPEIIAEFPGGIKQSHPSHSNLPPGLVPPGMPPYPFYPYTGLPLPHHNFSGRSVLSPQSRPAQPAPPPTTSSRGSTLPPPPLISTPAVTTAPTTARPSHSVSVLAAHPSSFSPTRLHGHLPPHKLPPTTSASTSRSPGLPHHPSTLSLPPPGLHPAALAKLSGSLHPPPPTTQALPANVPPSAAIFGGAIDDGDEDEEENVSRDPTPPPKLDDSECHRTENALFIRHWNRGEHNSCARTDLVFKPVPDSKLARKREERARRQAEREREEREKQRKSLITEKREAAKSEEQRLSALAGEIPGPMVGLYDRLRGLPDHTHLRLGDYSRPHSGVSPGSSRSTTAASGFLPGVVSSAGGGSSSSLSTPVVDSSLYQHFASIAALYPPGSRERLELESIEQRERERISELNERQLRVEEMLKREVVHHSLGLPHWLGGRPSPGFAHMVPATLAPPATAAGFVPPHYTTGLFPNASPSASAALLAAAEREHRLDLALLNAWKTNAGAGDKALLYMSGLDVAAAALSSYNARPPLLRPGDPHHPGMAPPLPPSYSSHAAAAVASLMGAPRPFEETLQQLSQDPVHRHQLLMERDRFLGGPPGPPPGPFRP